MSTDEKIVEVIDDRLDEESASQKSSGQDKVAINNLRVIFPEAAETYLRLLKGGGIMPQDPKARRKDGKRYDVFDPKYPKCPACVKINETGGVNKENLKRCNAGSPKKYHGHNLSNWWIVHMERHFDVWYEMTKRTHENGGLYRGDSRTEAPPGSTVVMFPQWRAIDGKSSSPNMSDYEKRLAEMRAQVREEEAVKEVAEQSKSEK